MVLRITTWNVNGIRNPFGYQPWRDKRTFDAMFDILEADIVIMQELKIQKKDLRDDMVLVPGWDCYFSLPKQKKGYSGVGIYTRQSVCAPIRAEEGVLGVLCPPGSNTSYCDLPDDQHIGGYLSATQLADCGVDAAEIDSEGRCVVLEFPAFVIFGLYCPANTSGMRDDMRRGFYEAVDARVRNLTKQGKRVIVTGDLNITQGEIDTANAKENMKKEGITHEEWISSPNRRLFNHLLEDGEVIGEKDEGREQPVMWDICRGFHPGREGMYTHWDTKINARPGNFGARIDFILCTLDMKSWFCESDIQEGLMGSDHCPVYANVKEMIDIKGLQVNVKDVMNPPGTFKDGKRLKEYSVKEVPAFSAKLLPEFDKRRSIKDMFTKKPSLKPSTSSVGNSAPTDQTHDTIQSHHAPVLEDTQVSLGGSEAITGSQQTITSLNSGSPAASPERKRSAPQTSSRPLKRSKSGVSVASATPASRGQQSLKGFFKSNVPAPIPGPVLAAAEAAGDENADDEALAAAIKLSSATTLVESNHASQDSPNPIRSLSPPELPPPPNEFQVSDAEDEEFIDPIASKESWANLFTKRAAPLCESHEEPCKIMKTGKKGFNCGREFYMCARPLGPTGNKERGTQWRCPTFIWTSDWNPGKIK